ncbi:hypothetical protein B0H14DRAFT_2788619 [Mycena olivaceomarginata]|nr:hypothetical protein B0H14DRAFT_2788619 [Mycena olivaceomarginata]
MHASVSVQLRIGSPVSPCVLAKEDRINVHEVEAASLEKGLEHEDADVIMKKHIKLLHKYNDSKDATQIVIGKLATLRETTGRQIHNRDLRDCD